MFKILLLNPPSINNIRYTRESRCQEQEDILGTIKPPLTLAILASLLRNQGLEIILLDATAQNLDSEQIISLLDKKDFAPTHIIFPTTTPTLDGDMFSVKPLKEKYQSSLITFGAHVSALPEQTLNAYPWLDMIIVGEPEEPVLDLFQNAGANPRSILDRSEIGNGLPVKPARMSNLDE